MLNKSLKLFLGMCLLGSASAMIATDAYAQASVSIRIGVAPPPLRVERPYGHRHGYIWIPGYWNWDGARHVWMDGYWERERRGYRYVPASWVAVQGQWVFYPGYWEPLAPPGVLVTAPPYGAVVAPSAPPALNAPAAPVPPPVSNPVPPGQDPNFSYYCHNPDGYYPAVNSCASGWQQVPR